ncbi:uncharacterized protein K452DRAFT_238691 [Aplosporella prunicola CBS 121167]|uniref:Uncharacterized protein n=1 Tax=Aplosporella prunicola CBS 121167 TaxID=1176127 RepID=A0A6A6AVR6_9PEZI|nr:uncharacterized protein K452DRAFT_238691 [Aplosporella prunicola CBS 121167]KAF2135790.1 hypothetical protein K452DRAFT_238691 [Aplosporella prunicola CBS 121167]
MDKVTGREKEEEARWQRQQEEKNKSVFQKWSDRLNEAAGGGPEAEKTEDLLDKAIDAYQEHVMHEGPQDNESAIEQAKDEFISDYIRRMYKAKTGHEFPIHDK